MQVPDNVLDLLANATAQARGIVDQIRPEQLAAPTPCSEWDVRALLNHVIEVVQLAPAAVHGTALPSDGDDRVGDRPAATFAAVTREAETALRTPGALDRTYAMPWGEIPGQMLAWILCTDLVIHAWDLARATGQSTALDPALCDVVLATGRQMMREEYRQPGGGFGPEVPIAAEAPAADRLAAFYGRRP